ncbi:MAG TPA: aspartyl/asparaginyl beta-hydroxylase domain-containing protein [Bauldia sp.]|nr:aspartyl/asparaginyl beta-hydroxylase domain-containing protein [Bauldia sp.]
MSMAERSWLSDRFYKLGRRFIWSLDSYFGRKSKVGDHEFFDVAEFPWVPSIEADWGKVRAELDQVMKRASDLPNIQDISKDHLHLTRDDGWKSYFFFAFGFRMKGNCRRCPETAKLLKRMPGMKTAMFSILAPGKHLPPHRGPYKGVLRLHLGLLIPEPADKCGIRVGREIRHWQEGKIMIFDDCFEHEAWNDTDKHRVVLFVDIVRPMRFPANLYNAILTWMIALSPFVLGAAGSYRRWEKRFEAVANQDAPAA